MPSEIPSSAQQKSTECTVFHVTHWKAGSQWIYKILREVAGDRNVIRPTSLMNQFLDEAIVEGAIYPTIYLDRDSYYSVSLPKNSRKFVVIRDLRDTLVSAYFSLKYSHKPIDNIPELRQRLETMSMEDGLLMLMTEWLPACARIQQSWADSGEDLVKYEDLLNNDTQILERVLIDYCRLDVTPEQLQEVVVGSRFESLTGGRERGNEDIMAHTRKGVSGDWLNHFTPKVTRKFNEQYQGLIDKVGYPLVEM